MIPEPKTDETILTNVTAQPHNGNQPNEHVMSDRATQELYETRKENGLK